MGPTAIPSLDQIAANPASAAGLPVETILGLLAKHSAAGSALTVALLLSKPGGPQMSEPDSDDEMLEPDAAAALLHKSRQWLFRNKRKLSFVRVLSRKSILCSKKGLLRWLAAQKA
jgi:hypothetical protein